MGCLSCSFSEASGPFFPEDATFILCGFLIQGAVVKPAPALFVIYTGVLIVDLVLYLFGRKYCRMAVCHRWFQKILPPERLAMLEGKFKKKGILSILLGRHFIGFSAQIFLVPGIMKMHPLTFLLADAFTVTSTIAVMVSIGYVGGHSLKDIGIDVRRTEYLLFLILFMFAIGYLILKYMKGKIKQKLPFMQP